MGRFLILFLFSFGICVPWVWGFGSGINFFSSLGSCSGVSLTGSFGSSDEGDGGGGEGDGGGSGGLDIGAPVDIPAPIAKSINPIDPSSLRCRLDGSEEIICTGSISDCNPSDSIADDDIALFANIDDDTTAERITVESSNGCDFQVTVESSVTDIPIAWTVCEVEGCDSGSVSPPVITVITDESVFGVVITNDNDFTGFDIQGNAMAFSSDGILLAFAYQNSDGETCVGTVPVLGGAPEELACGLPAAVQNLQYDADNVLYALLTTGSIYRINSGGDMTVLASVKRSVKSAVRSSYRSVTAVDSPQAAQVSPDGGLLVYLTEDSTGHRILNRLDLSSGEVTENICAYLAGEPLSGSYYMESFFFLNADNIIVALRDSAGDYSAARCEFTSFPDGNFSTEEFLPYYQSRLVHSSREDGNGYCYACDPANSGAASICCISDHITTDPLTGYLDDPEVQVITAEGTDATSIRVSNNGDFLLVEQASGECTVKPIGVDALNNVTDGGEQMDVAESCENPLLSPNGDQYFAYFREVGEAVQVAWSNTNNATLPEDDGSGDCHGNEVEDCSELDNIGACRAAYRPVYNTSNGAYSASATQVEYHNCYWVDVLAGYCTTRGGTTFGNLNCSFSDSSNVEDCNATEVSRGDCSSLGDEGTCEQRYQKFYLNPDDPDAKEPLDQTDESLGFDYHNCVWRTSVGCSGNGELTVGTFSYGIARCQ